jgi:hypothetical protein
MKSARSRLLPYGNGRIPMRGSSGLAGLREECKDSDGPDAEGLRCGSGGLN